MNYNTHITVKQLIDANTIQFADDPENAYEILKVEPKTGGGYRITVNDPTANPPAGDSPTFEFFFDGNDFWTDYASESLMIVDSVATLSYPIDHDEYIK